MCNCTTPANGIVQIKSKVVSAPVAQARHKAKIINMFKNTGAAAAIAKWRFAFNAPDKSAAIDIKTIYGPF